MSQIQRFTSPGKYHGLKNQGATCYLNSVLQVLYMTKEFREAVTRYTGDTECIELHLKALFGDLNEHPAYAYKITKTLGINNVCEQRDAAEYFEKILRLTDSESKASKIFHGELTHKNECSECGTVTTTNGPFWHLPLALLDFSSEDYSVEDGIEKFFSASEVSGINQMYCDVCDDKADATLKSVMTHHPEVLMLLLKRFEFDYSCMGYVKVNRFVNVPLTLQIPENQTCRYELYAVVDHFGDLRSGHYTANIRSDDDDRWYNFNDDNVSEPFQVDVTERSQTAYLLFYRKKKMDAADTCTQDTRGMPTSEVPQMDISDSNEQHQDTGKISKKHEGGEEAEAGNVTAEVSIEIHEETRDIDIPLKKMRDEEDMGGKTGADDQTERREPRSIEGIDDVTQERSQEDSVDVRQNIPHINDCKQDVSDVHAQHGDLYKQDEDGKTRDEQSEKKRKSSTKYLDKNDEAYEDNVQNIYEDQEGKQKPQRFSQGVEDQNNEGFDDRRNTPEQQISVTTHKDVGVEKQDKEQGKKGDTEHIPNREDSDPRQAELAGRGRLTESQRVGRDEKTRHMNAQSRAEICDEKIIEEEHRPDSGITRSSVRENMRKKTAEETPKGSNKSGRIFKRKSKTELQDTLSKGVHNLNLNKKHTTKRLMGSVEEGTKTDMATDSRAKRLRTSRKLFKRKKKDVDGKKRRTAGTKCVWSCVGQNPDSD